MINSAEIALYRQEKKLKQPSPPAALYSATFLPPVSCVTNPHLITIPTLPHYVVLSDNAAQHTTSNNNGIDSNDGPTSVEAALPTNSKGVPRVRVTISPTAIGNAVGHLDAYKIKDSIAKSRLYCDNLGIFSNPEGNAVDVPIPSSNVLATNGNFEAQGANFEEARAPTENAASVVKYPTMAASDVVVGANNIAEDDREIPSSSLAACSDLQASSLAVSPSKILKGKLENFMGESFSYDNGKKCFNTDEAWANLDEKNGRLSPNSMEMLDTLGSAVPMSIMNDTFNVLDFSLSDLDKMNMPDLKPDTVNTYIKDLESENNSRASLSQEAISPHPSENPGLENNSAQVAASSDTDQYNFNNFKSLIQDTELLPEPVREVRSLEFTSQPEYMSPSQETLTKMEQEKKSALPLSDAHMNVSVSENMFDSIKRSKSKRRREHELLVPSALQKLKDVSPKAQRTRSKFANRIHIDDDEAQRAIESILPDNENSNHELPQSLSLGNGDFNSDVLFDPLGSGNPWDPIEQRLNMALGPATSSSKSTTGTTGKSSPDTSSKSGAGTSNMSDQSSKSVSKSRHELDDSSCGGSRKKSKKMAIPTSKSSVPKRDFLLPQKKKKKKSDDCSGLFIASDIKSKCTPTFNVRPKKSQPSSSVLIDNPPSVSNGKNPQTRNIPVNNNSNVSVLKETKTNVAVVADSDDDIQVVDVVQKVPPTKSVLKMSETSLSRHVDFVRSDVLRSSNGASSGLRLPTKFRSLDGKAVNIPASLKGRLVPIGSLNDPGVLQLAASLNGNSSTQSITEKLTIPGNRLNNPALRGVQRLGLLNNGTAKAAAASSEQCFTIKTSSGSTVIPVKNLPFAGVTNKAPASNYSFAAVSHRAPVSTISAGNLQSSLVAQDISLPSSSSVLNANNVLHISGGNLKRSMSISVLSPQSSSSVGSLNVAPRSIIKTIHSNAASNVQKFATRQNLPLGTKFKFPPVNNASLVQNGRVITLPKTNLTASGGLMQIPSYQVEVSNQNLGKPLSTSTTFRHYKDDSLGNNVIKQASLGTATTLLQSLSGSIPSTAATNNGSSVSRADQSDPCPHPLPASLSNYPRFTNQLLLNNSNILEQPNHHDHNNILVNNSGKSPSSQSRDIITIDHEAHDENVTVGELRASDEDDVRGNVVSSVDSDCINVPSVKMEDNSTSRLAASATNVHNENINSEIDESFIRNVSPSQHDSNLSSVVDKPLSEMCSPFKYMSSDLEIASDCVVQSSQCHLSDNGCVGEESDMSSEVSLHSAKSASDLCELSPLRTEESTDNTHYIDESRVSVAKNLILVNSREKSVKFMYKESTSIKTEENSMLRNYKVDSGDLSSVRQQLSLTGPVQHITMNGRKYYTMKSPSRKISSELLQALRSRHNTTKIRASVGCSPIQSSAQSFFVRDGHLQNDAGGVGLVKSASYNRNTSVSNVGGSSSRCDSDYHELDDASFPDIASLSKYMQAKLQAKREQKLLSNIP